MKILVISDSHGDVASLRQAIRRSGAFAMLIHLGDGARDADAVRPLLEGRPLLAVRGNCDLGSALPTELTTEEGGKRLLCTHGHLYNVKYTDALLRQAARGKGADIALYGHTHVPVQQYDDGLYLCNPGSLRRGDYALLEIVPQGVMWLPQRI